MDQIKIGRYIAEKRLAHGLTQKALGEMLGVSSKAVSKWERGICLPDASLYLELCGILGITVNELFAGEDVEEENIAVQSEKNIMGIAEKSQSDRGRARSIIFIMAAALLIAALAIGKYCLDNRVLLSRYIEPYSASEEGRLLERAAGVELTVMPFRIHDGCSRIDIDMRTYEYGKLKETGRILSISPTDARGGKMNGIVSLIPGTDSDEVVVRLLYDREAPDTGVICTDEISAVVPMPDAGSYTVAGAGMLEEKKEFGEGAPVDIYSYEYGESGIVGSLAERMADVRTMSSVRYSYVFSITYY